MNYEVYLNDCWLGTVDAGDEEEALQRARLQFGGHVAPMLHLVPSRRQHAPRPLPVPPPHTNASRFEKSSTG